MRERQFWWARFDGYDSDEVVEVSFDDGKPVLVHTTGSDIGIDAAQLDRYGVRLIERVLPPGRATAAALHGALVASSRNGSGYVSRLQGCQVTDEEGETVGHTTLVDGYFDLQRAAEILAAGVDAT